MTAAQALDTLRTVLDDPESEHGRALWALVSDLIAKRKAHRERTAAGLRAKRERHERYGTVPYGWRLAANQFDLEADPAEQTLRGQIRAWRGQGHSLREIAEILNAQGLRTRRGTLWRFQYVDALDRARVDIQDGAAT